MIKKKTISRLLPEEVKSVRNRLPKNSYGSALLAALLLWWDGYDLRSILPRSTFYRIKSKLLTYGFDVSEVRI